jgi:MFS family permease
MKQFHSYGKLFKIPGAIGFSSAAFLGRLPAGMIILAIILPISKLMGSYASAGVIAAFAMIGMAFATPFSSRLLDRYGQGRILLIFAVLNFLGIFALLTCIYFNASIEILCVTAAITGATRLSTGTMARTRWTYVITNLYTQKQRDQMLQAAYAFESIVDEVVFISAPILATLLCTAIHPLAGLVCCLFAYLIGSIALAVQRNTQPVVEHLHKKQPFALMIPGLRVIFLAVLLIGISAGAVEVIVVARADHLNLRPLIGLLMATLSFSSMLAGFWYGTRSFKLPLASLWIGCLGLLVLVLIPFIFATNFIALMLVLFIAGLSIAPTSIAGQLLTEQLLPTPLLNEGMSLIVTAMILGMAIGSCLAGVLIDRFGTYSAGTLPAISVFIALTLGTVYNYNSTMLAEKR